MPRVSVILGIFVNLIRMSHRDERAGLIAALVLVVQTIFFFIFYQQMSTSLNLFAQSNVDLDFRLFGWHLFTWIPEQYQNLNSIWIVLLSPVLVFIYNSLGRVGKDPSIAAKFAWGFAAVAIGFFIYGVGARWAVNGQVSSWIMVWGYGLYSLGELLVSGLGLAMIARYVPARMGGFMMGAYFVASGISQYLGSVVANFAHIPEGIDDPIESLTIYTSLFNKLGFAGIGCTAIAIAMLPLDEQALDEPFGLRRQKYPAAGGAKRGIQHRILIAAVRQTCTGRRSGASCAQILLSPGGFLAQLVLSVTDPVDRPAAHRFLQASRRFAGPAGADVRARSLQGMRGAADGRHIAPVEGGANLAQGGIAGIDEDLHQLLRKLLIAVGERQELLPIDRGVALRVRGARRGCRARRGRAARVGKRRRCAAEVTFDGQGEALSVQGLGQITVHTGLEALPLGAGHGIGRESDDGYAARAGFARADLARRLIAVHHGHLAIHQNEVMAAAFPGGNGLCAVAHDIDLEAHALQTAAGHFLVDRVILGKQDPPLVQPLRARLAEQHRLRALMPLGAVERHDSCEALAQLAVGYRLEQKGREAQLLEVPGAVHPPGRSEQHQPNMIEARIAGDLAAELEPVAVGHHVVEHGEIEALAALQARRE